MRNPFRKDPLVAAARLAPARDLQTASIPSRSISEAWEVWRRVGEIHYATNQQARLVGRVGWDVLIDGQQQAPERAGEILTAAFGHEIDSLAEQAALHLQVAGGYHQVRTPLGWFILPTPPDHKAKKFMDDADVNVLNTNPDPRDPDLTDSPVLAALDVARELILARAQARAAARNRTAQLNTVIYPLEGAGADPEEFEKEFTAVMTAPLENEHSASVVVPNLIGFQGDWIDKWKTLDLTGPVEKNLHVKIADLVRQIAVILDIPPQVLLGMEDLNHWAARAMLEDNWFGHVEPLAKTVGEGFAVALAQASDLDPDTLQVIPDPAPLMKRQPPMSDILKAHQQKVVGDKFVRRMLGADEDDAPEDDELVPDSDGGSDDRDPVEGEEPDTEGSEPVAAAAEPEPEVEARLLAEIDVQAYDATEDLISDVTERALERLGAKVRSIGQGKDLGIPDVGTLSNVDLALKFSGDIPNADAAVQAVVDSALPKLDRIMQRAYTKVFDLGVRVNMPEQDLQAARELFGSLLSEHVRQVLNGGSANPWEISRRVISVAGGNGDSAITAGAGMHLVNTGIALGQHVLNAVANLFGLRPRAYTWVHRSVGDPHPKHKDFDGTEFDGEYISSDGIVWFPGDHAGCRCIPVPRFRRG